VLIVLPIAASNMGPSPVICGVDQLSLGEECSCSPPHLLRL